MNKPNDPTDSTGNGEMRRLTRRSFTVGAIAAAAGAGAWAWLNNAALEDGIPWPLRRMLRFNQWLASGYASPHHLAPTFPATMAQRPPRTNGLIGLDNEVEADAWELRIEHEGRPGHRIISLSTIRKVPRFDLVTELKCVEGWSEIMHFGGVRFLDFLSHLELATRSGRAPDPAGNPNDLYRYVYLATPDEDYYVGLDMASALHPQTILCDTMNEMPLTRAHGAPLRLFLTVKYGFKSLKRLGLVRFHDQRPADYWAERGYDWYAGL
jgi:DMSO/TMAO reductase YedYZ molybdopterin-dependent catalytic subunit